MHVFLSIFDCKTFQAGRGLSKICGVKSPKSSNPLLFILNILKRNFYHSHVLDTMSKGFVDLQLLYGVLNCFLYTLDKI